MTNLSSLDYLENYTISKSINDRMWKLTATLDKEDAPSAMIGVRAFGTDHASVEHCLFVGFIPGASYIRQSANNKVNITAYDFSWYLSVQHLSEKENFFVYNGMLYNILLPIYIKKLIGGDNSLNVTGLAYGGYTKNCENEGTYSWSPDMTAMEWIEEVEETCNMRLHIFLEQSGAAYVPTVYFLKSTDIDTYLPAEVTFTSPSDYVTSLNVSTNEMEDYNRVIVYGTEPLLGNWYTKVIQTAAVTAEEEKPIEYMFMDAKLDTQAKVDSKATTLFNILNGLSSATFTATLTNRYDLCLSQKVKFVGYSDIPEVTMRIISITYQRILNQDSVTISFIADQSFANLKLLARYITNDPIQTQQQVINDATNKLANLEIGEVTAVDGNTATLTLERTGNEITARILD